MQIPSVVQRRRHAGGKIQRPRVVGDGFRDVSLIFVRAGTMEKGSSEIGRELNRQGVSANCSYEVAVSGKLISELHIRQRSLLPSLAGHSDYGGAKDENQAANENRFSHLQCLV